MEGEDGVLAGASITEEFDKRIGGRALQRGAHFY